MTSGSGDRQPLRVAVVGSGPSGFYAAEALLRAPAAVEVDLLERLPMPYGLVRSGVAPDHPKLKQPVTLYARIAAEPGFRFFGNVTVGRDVSVGQLRELYHAVIFACGAESDRRLCIPGEALPGSHTAREFVGWYNGHPDFRDHRFDFSHPAAVVIGQGNVAADVARILAKPPDELARTDIASHALAALAQSRIRDIHVIGRRGPAQASFTPKELREFGEIPGCAPRVNPAALLLDPASAAELEDRSRPNPPKVMESFRAFAARPAGETPAARRRVHFHFLRSPVAFEGARRVERVRLEHNVLTGEPFHQSATGTGETSEIDAGLVFRSIGYRGLPIEGLPFDGRRGILPNRDGRIVEGDDVLPNLYATGWIKRGATGIIGTNRADSVATVRALLDDFGDRAATPDKRGGAGLAQWLASRDVRVVDFADWERIDRLEVERGRAAGKPREKFTTIAELLAAAG